MRLIMPATIGRGYSLSFFDRGTPADTIPSCPTMDADEIISLLELAPHPEGGYFRETYRSPESISASALPDRYAGPRSFSTAIYFLLKGGQKSHLHRLASDETWYFNRGSAATIHILDPDGSLETKVLGPDLTSGEAMQAVLPAGSWFGATVNDPEGYILVSCSVAPGFDFADFELGKRDELVRLFPQHKSIIHDLTEPT